MKIKKITAGLVSLLCVSALSSIMPYSEKTVYASQLVYNDFESNYDGWYGNTDSVVFKVDSENGFNDSKGLSVSARKSKSDGISSAKGLYLSGDINYTYKFKVYSESDETFHITLKYLDMESGEYFEEELINQNTSGKKWAELSAEYKAPKNSAEFILSVTTDSTNDFSIDDIEISTMGKKSANAAYAAETAKGLKDEFADYFRVGNILNSSTVLNSAITANIIKDYNSIECENEMKPDATIVQSQCKGTEVGVSISRAASILDFCADNNIAVRGHTLVWHSQTPTWFFKENYNASGAWVSESVMDARMESYIKNLFATINEQYSDLNLYAYDVANECISDDSNRTANYGGSREPGENISGQSPWVQVYGDNSFVEKAFTYARKYAPEDCKLFYNDYNEYWDHKRDSIYKMCKSLYEKGLLDGVGMQSHINANYTGFSGVEAYTTAMNLYASIGCEVQITELDISTENGTYTAQQQADKYKAIFQAAMANDNVTAVCIWGPNDANTWIKTENAPLLYDTSNQPKLAYTTLTSLIDESEWGDGSNYGETVEPNEYGWYFHSTFEGDVDSWQARGSSTLLTSGRTAYIGGESLLVMDRTAAWNGAYRTLNSKAFVPENEYSFSVNATYFDGNPTETFYLKLQYTDANGDTQYSTIAEATVYQGQWSQIANRNYTIPSDASNMQLYVETAESLENFYIDEAIGAVGGTYIEGAVPTTPSLTLKGDANESGNVDVADVVAVRRYLVNAEKYPLTAQGIINADVQGGSNGINAQDAVAIQKFVLGMISEFEATVSNVDIAAMEGLFANVSIASSYKDAEEGNPLYTQRFGADPGVMEYDGRVYVYTTNDVIEYDGDGNVVENTYALVNKINCISSDDMVNWTDHGAINVAGSSGAAKWATCSWAPCAAHKTINGKEKFFLYFCNGGNGVSVLTADSPTGPWSDPLGKALITRSTANCSDITWLFDPAVFVDDDGTGYLCFGGGVPDGMTANPGTSRVVKLGADMISLDGTPQKIDAPYLFEDSGINKIGNKYYYTYCSNWNTSGNSYGLTSGAIQYMISDNPLGPYTYGGELFKNQGNFFGLYGNNHHSIIALDNQLYLFYHARAVEAAMGITGNYRSPQVNKLSMSGTNMQSVTGTMTGIGQLITQNPYVTNQAETIYRQAGVNVSGLGDTVVNEINKGDWFGVSGFDFTKGAKNIKIRVSSANGGAIKICLGSETGEAVGYVDVPATGGSFKDITASVSNISGEQDIYFVFSDAMEVDSWGFS